MFQILCLIFLIKPNSSELIPSEHQTPHMGTERAQLDDMPPSEFFKTLTEVGLTWCIGYIYTSDIKNQVGTTPKLNHKDRKAHCRF